MIWLVLAALSGLAVALVVPPLLRGARAAAGQASDLAVYRDQLGEIENDLARGLISPAEAEAARIEVKRRMLAAGTRAGEAMANAVPRRGVAVGAGAGIVAFSLALYLTLGRPTLPGRTFDPAAARLAEQQLSEQAAIEEVDRLIARLAGRLKASPNDPTGWRLLGTAYFKLRRLNEAVDALAHAVALDPKNTGLRSQYGEALVFAAEGTVTPAAAKTFDEVLAGDPKDSRARFYRGVALLQAGKEREALALWVEVVRDGPADAPWMGDLREQATLLAEKLKLDPKTVLPPAK